MLPSAEFICLRAAYREAFWEELSGLIWWGRSIRRPLLFWVHVIFFHSLPSRVSCSFEGKCFSTFNLLCLVFVRYYLSSRTALENSVLSNYWMRLSRIWRILQISEGVITPSEICWILHILRKPNSIIALLFIQNISSFLKGFRYYALRFFRSPNISQPCPQVFSLNGSIICSGLHFLRHFDVIGSIIFGGLHFWRHWFNMARILSKFGEQQLVMVNYPCGFNQSETGKYFEWIIIFVIALRSSWENFFADTYTRFALLTQAINLSALSLCWVWTAWENWISAFASTHLLYPNECKLSDSTVIT